MRNDVVRGAEQARRTLEDWTFGAIIAFVLSARERRAEGLDDAHATDVDDEPAPRRARGTRSP